MNRKSILITGCSTGIGLDAAQTLQQRGYQVFATAREQSSLEMLDQCGLNPIELELKSAESIKNALSQVLDKTGGTLDFLFNNGAYGQPGAVEDLPTDVLREQFETNVFGWHDLTRQVIAVMREQGHGRIVQNSSILGFVCMPYRGAYNASKFALEGLTDTLRLELAGSNISISLIEPGPILSQFRANALKAFKKNIDWESSVHSESYRSEIARMEKEGPAAAFTLGPESVTRALIHALESKRPKIRYRITTPTKIMNVLKRLLPSRMLDNLLIKG